MTYKRLSDRPDLERVYFREANEATVDQDPALFNNKRGGQAVRFSLPSNGAFENRLGAQLSDGSTNSGIPTTKDRKIDVSILAATNRDLERESERERFRRDLYFRLAVIILKLPPLRERGDDVFPLADFYLRRFAAKYGKSARRLTPAARELLRAYPWPGNVREVSHVLERAVLWSQGTELTPEHLSLSVPL